MPEPLEQDALALLEEKILRALETIAQIRKERDAAIAVAAENEPLKAKIAELVRDLDTVRAERDALRADKDVVRKRIEKLLAQIDTLGQS